MLKISSQLCFGSRIIYEKSSPQRPLTSDEKTFIDKFDSGNREGAKFLGEGVTSKVYYSPRFNFVIKQNHDNPYVPKKYRGEDGSLAHENEMLLSISPKVEHSQYGIAYVETEKGGEYLISTFVSGKAADRHFNPLTPTRMNRLLRTLYRLDKSEILQPDLSSPNILFDDLGYANLIDYQYANKFDVSRRYSNYGLRTADFPDFEAPNNATMYEGAALSGYVRGMSPNETSEFLRTYNQYKAYYNHKKAKRLSGALSDTEKVKAEAFDRINSDVLNCEVLKMNMLNCQRRQYSCHDANVVKERNILKSIPLMILAKDSAEELANYRPINNTNNDYLNYMRKLGKFWLSNYQSWYPETLDWILDLMTGAKKTTSKIIFPSQFDNFSGTDIVKISNSNYIENKHSEEDRKLREILQKAFKDKYISYSGKEEFSRIVNKVFRGI